MSQNEKSEPLVEIKVDVKRLKGRRGILCGLLGAAVITTVLCLGLLAGKTHEINAGAGGRDVCTLFTNFQTSSTADPSVCHYVIAGSSLVLVFLLVLLTETLLAVLIAFAYTE